MNSFFAAIWYPFVVGVGVCILLEGKANRIFKKGHERFAMTLFVISRVWAFIPLLYGMPQMFRDLGILGIFAVVPAWSIGMVGLMRDIFDLDLVALLGIHEPSSNSVIGSTEIGWIILGIVIIGLLSAFYRSDAED